MSKHDEDGLMKCLFSGQDMTLVNVKFFRGSRDMITDEEFRDQVTYIETQKKSGRAVRTAEAPRSGREPIDVRDLVADI